MAYREPKTFDEIVSWGFNGKRVSWRRYGKNNELRRPIFHRFEIKGGDTAIDVFKENLTQSCALLERLAKKAR